MYRNSHYLYFHLRVQYETVFDRCVPKIVCRCVSSLCAIWSWDLVGPVFAQWGVCPDVYTVCSSCHRGTQLGGLQGHMKGLNPHPPPPHPKVAGVWGILRREESETKDLVHIIERSFSTFQPFWCSECLRMQKWLEKC